MKILKLKIRPLLISFITLLIVPSLVFGAARGHGYLTIRGLKIDAQRLAEQGKYQEALERLSETDGKWTTQAVKNEIQKGKEIYKQLAESASNLAEGRERYYNGDYVGAIEFFKKVIPGDENYSSALKWLAVAEEKLKDDGQEVAGVSTELDDQVADLGQGAEPILEYPQINEPFTAFPSPLDLSWLFNSQITPRSFPQPTPSNSIAQQSYQSDPVVDQRRFLEDCNSDKESLDRDRDYKIQSENRAYQQARQAAIESFAGAGLFSSGIAKTALGQLEVEHSYELQNIEASYNYQLSRLRARGCNF